MKCLAAFVRVSGIGDQPLLDDLLGVQSRMGEDGERTTRLRETGAARADAAIGGATQAAAITRPTNSRLVSMWGWSADMGRSGRSPDGAAANPRTRAVP